jgi:acyl carrier protein
MSTKDIVKEFIVRELVREENFQLQDSDKLIETGIIDSMGIISLLGFLEAEFSIQIESDELVPENLDTVESISELVGRKLGA